ncbi:MAG: cyclodeaminase/cyclohydrolase family protein [Anaerolineaceae bacterium]|nr:cyclodeaminase/cyclohydrolase family protein [Anaerolineaceae bacterium]
MRRAVIQAAWIQAAEVPLANADGCAAVLELALHLRGRSNPNAASDLSCAFYLALAGLKGCIANVEINLPAIKDENVKAKLSDHMQTLIQTSKDQTWE